MKIISLIISILLVLLMDICILNCGGDNQQDQQQSFSSDSQSTQKKVQQPEVNYHSVDGFFSGNHALALISNITKDPYDTGYVCLLDTGVSSTAKFYFQQYDGFLSAQLSMSKIRISFLADTTRNAPYCKFRWAPSNFKEREWENNVVYIVVCVKPNQIYRK